MSKSYLEAKYSASDIAKWLINFNEEQIAVNGAEMISNLKLQKLLYYAQGGALGLTGVPLFNDEIEAWRHGPVVRDVYSEYRDFAGEGISPNKKEPIVEIDDATENILEEVYSVFGQYSAWKLREMTHNETPWSSVEMNDVISKESIEKYFKEIYISD